MKPKKTPVKTKATKTPAKTKTAAKTKKPAAKKAAAARTKNVAKQRKVTFAYRAEAGSKIFLSGTFNNWDPTAKKMTYKKKDGIYSAIIALAPGSYEYKFVIDGTWCADPECADWVQNDHGTLNSVKHVSV